LELVADLPANEHVTMQIASQVFRLKTPPNGLVFFPDGEPAYIVRRFDYDAATGHKLTQEDFCQLSARSRQTHGENYKYDGSYEEMGRILGRYCPAYAIEVEKLYAQIVFNYVIGNGDAHLKNFSLLETPFGDHSLSPCYDLLCTTVHLPNDTRTALELFDGDFETESFQANGFYSRQDFLELADRYGMLKSRAEAFLDQCILARPKIKELIDRSLLSIEARQRFLTTLGDRLSAL
jgi:serine/threonine-protein kinase HipA